MDEKQKWLMNEFRRVHAKWKPRNNVKKAARVSRGKYKCAHCEALFGPTQIDIDHIEPVINPHTSFVDWNEYVERLFVPESGYQVLCKECHSIKTHKQENVIRKKRIS